MEIPLGFADGADAANVDAVAADAYAADAAKCSDSVADDGYAMRMVLSQYYAIKNAVPCTMH